LAPSPSPPLPTPPSTSAPSSLGPVVVTVEDNVFLLDGVRQENFYAGAVDEIVFDISEVVQDHGFVVKDQTDQTHGSLGLNQYTMSIGQQNPVYMYTCSLHISDEMGGWIIWGFAPPSSPPSSIAKAQGDPHIHFAHGGQADFRGKNDTFYALLSAPGYQFAALTSDTDFLLPRPQLVHGSFFSRAAWTLRGRSGALYGVLSDASEVSFTVYNLSARVDRSISNGTSPQKQTGTANDAHLYGTVLSQTRGVWKQWWHDGIRVFYKQSTIYVRSGGWEVNATRRPVYHWIGGPSKWRFDFSMRPFDGTVGFEAHHGEASKTCFPHGIIGQSWDGDDRAVDGAVDDYKFHAENPSVTTKAMAEGAIEGGGNQYALSSAFSVGFVYQRFHRKHSDACLPRTLADGGFRSATTRPRTAQTAGSQEPDRA
jgi:hypothetical protein